MDFLGRFLGRVALLVLCWLALVYVSVPLMLLAMAVGLCVGAGLAVIGYLRVFAAAEDERILVTPASTLARRRGAPYRYWDDGWSGYLTQQVERDIAAAVVWPGRTAWTWWRTARTWWQKARTWARSQPEKQFTVIPAVPPPVGFLVGVTAGVECSWAAVAVVAEAVTAIPRLVRLGAIAALRGWDASARWWHGATATCPHCCWVTRIPAYRCVCKTVHRDLRPGRQGVWWHVCHCRKRLPTTVMRAVEELTPVCPSCGEPLFPRAGVTRDVRIAVSGGPGAGKTQLLIRAAAAMTGDDDHSTAWEPADDQSAAWLRSVQDLSTQHGPERPAEPALLTLQGGGRRLCYLHIGSVNSTQFMTGVKDPALWQLGTTRRHLLVLDPTLIPSVRDQVDQAGLDGTHAKTNNGMAELPYRLLVAHLNHFGTRTRRCSLAIVIAKADLLAPRDLAPAATPAGTSSAQLRAWLLKMKLYGLVESAGHDFHEVRYFLVGNDATPEDAVAPFSWLLSRHPRGAGTP